MGVSTEKIFGRRELVHIVSPDFLSLPKLEINVAAGIEIKSGEFIGADGALMTLTDKVKSHFLVVEATRYKDFLDRDKPSGVAEGFFGSMVIHTKTFNEDGTAFAAGDQVSLADGKLVHVNATNTIVIGEIVSRGTDWISVTINS